MTATATATTATTVTAVGVVVRAVGVVIRPVVVICPVRIVGAVVVIRAVRIVGAVRIIISAVGTVVAVERSVVSVCGSAAGSHTRSRTVTIRIHLVDVTGGHGGRRVAAVQVARAGRSGGGASSIADYSGDRFSSDISGGSSGGEGTSAVVV